MAAALVVGAAVASSSSKAEVVSSCATGKSYAGIAIRQLSPKFDGLQATITPLGGYTGITATEHANGEIGLGYPQEGRAFVVAGVGGYAGDPASRFTYDWWAGGLYHYRPAFELGVLPAGHPYTVKIERVSGMTWRVSMNGRTPKDGVIRLAESSRGLPFPRMYLLVENETPPCNTGAFRFDRVLLRDHGSARWHPFPRTAAAYQAPGLKISASSITSFEATTIP